MSAPSTFLLDLQTLVFRSRLHDILTHGCLVQLLFPLYRTKIDLLLKVTVFWVVASCSLVEIYRLLRGFDRLNLRGSLGHPSTMSASYKGLSCVELVDLRSKIPASDGLKLSS
jgi:hypothetical protein